ncbi:MAG: phosphomannose isomerase type II C-terminal cupin domain [Limnochordia bacterium]|nr:phosphomannose isomerase type II C-terminal cupin domain [Limnochordia bacterium]
MIQKPWGYEEILAVGNGYKIKLLTIRLGSQTSLQRHKHREEKLILLQGELVVIVQADYDCPYIDVPVIIPRFAVHRLQNIGDIEAKILEIQRGEILDDNDIERLEDDYGRA